MLRKLVVARICRLSTVVTGSAVVCLAVFLASHSVQADEVDVAIAALAVGGAAVGIPISDGEKALVKPLVHCAVNGTPVGDCLKTALIEPFVEQLPQDLRPVVLCVALGTDPASCAGDEVTKRLPPNVRGLADCLARATSIVTCGTRFAQGQAQTSAAAMIGKLEAKAQAAVDKHFEPAPSAIQNIINLAIAISQNDVEGMIKNGGAAVAKHVVSTTISTLLPGVSALLAPVINAIVENRIDLATGLLKAAKDRDEARAAELIAEAYLLFHFEGFCNLPVIPGVLRDPVCGTLSKIINEIGSAAGAVTSYLIDLVKDPLGIPAKVTEDLQRSLAGKSNNCGTPEQYYAGHFAKCYHRAAYLQLTDPNIFANLEPSLNFHCRDNFKNCVVKRDLLSSSDNLSAICDPMRRVFASHVRELHDGLAKAASIYAASLQGFIDKQGKRACQRDFDEIEIKDFINLCESELKKQIRLGGDPRNLEPECSFRGEYPAFSAPSAHRESCLKAVQNADLPRMKKEACQRESQRELEEWTPSDLVSHQDPLVPLLPGQELDVRSEPLVPGLPGQIDKTPPTDLGTSQPPISCFSNMQRNAEGRCVCGLATEWNGSRCEKVVTVFSGSFSGNNLVGPQGSNQCPPERPIGTPPNCCPRDARYVNGVCLRNSGGSPGGSVSPGSASTSSQASGSTPPRSRRCPRHRPVGTYPRCCPIGMKFDAGACRRIARPPQPPPGGSVSTGQGPASPGAECPPARPVGKPPYCCPQGMSYSNGACRGAQRPPTPPSSPPVTPGTPPPAAQRCPTGMTGTPPNCSCPPGTTYKRRALGKNKCVPNPSPNPCGPGSFLGGDGKCYPKLG